LNTLALTCAFAKEIPRKKTIDNPFFIIKKKGKLSLPLQFENYFIFFRLLDAQLLINEQVIHRIE